MIGSTRKTHRSRLRGMAVTVEMHNTGDPAQRAEVVSVVEHVLSDRPGDWRVSIVGSQANDRWEMKIVGPKAVRADSAGELR